MFKTKYVQRLNGWTVEGGFGKTFGSAMKGEAVERE
jgi:hypothetical protein